MSSTGAAPGRRSGGRHVLRGQTVFSIGLVLALLLAAGFLVLPMVAILVRVGPGRLGSSFGHQATLDALRVTIESSAIALALIVVVGTPAAYLLATRRFPGRSLVLALLALPVVLPPAVAGIGLLVAFGSGGLFGPLLHSLGIELPFTTAAVVLAQAFVASPFYIGAAYAAFASVDPTLLDAARTLGASPARVFARVATPLAARGLGAGAALAWTRAAGEFGATLIFAGSFQGVTQTAPLAIYAELGNDLPGALALAAALLIVCAAILVLARAAGAVRL